MRRWQLILILSVIMTMVLTGCADGSNKVETPSGTNAEYGTVETYKEDVQTEEYPMDKQQEEITDEKTIVGVSIDFDYMRMSGKASNQFAVWIEDTESNVVKTIYATDFTAERRGYSTSNYSRFLSTVTATPWISQLST